MSSASYIRTGGEGGVRYVLHDAKGGALFEGTLDLEHHTGLVSAKCPGRMPNVAHASFGSGAAPTSGASQSEARWERLAFGEEEGEEGRKGRVLVVRLWRGAGCSGCVHTSGVRRRRSDLCARDPSRLQSSGGPLFPSLR